MTATPSTAGNPEDTRVALDEVVDAEARVRRLRARLEETRAELAGARDGLARLQRPPEPGREGADACFYVGMMAALPIVAALCALGAAAGGR